MSRELRLLVAGALLLTGAAALRFGGIDWLLPVFVEPDVHLASQVRLMDEATDDVGGEPAWGAYPHLIARLTWLLTPGEASSQAGTAMDLDEHLERARWPVLRVRLVVAMLSLLAVPATYLLARIWLSAAWSLVAAALTATSLLAIHFGAQARPHGAAAGLMALAVVACVRLRRRGDLGSYALAGVAIAAAVGCLQSGMATLGALLAAHAGLRSPGRWRHTRLLLPAAIIALGLAALAPFLLDRSGGADAARMEVDSGLLRQATHRIDPGDFNGRGYVRLVQVLWNWEPAILCGALLGAATWLLARTRRTAGSTPPGARVVLAFAIPYGLVVGLFEHCFERYVLPLVPFLAVLAAWGVAALCVRVRAPLARRAAIAVLLLPLLGYPTLVALRLVSARRAPSTSDLAAEWLQARVAPEGEPVLLTPWLDVPVLRLPASPGAGPTRETIDQGLGWRSYQSTLLRDSDPAPKWNLKSIATGTLGETLAGVTRDPAAWVEALPATLCMIDARSVEGTGTWNRVTLALRERARLVMRISPDAGADSWDEPLWYQDRAGGSAAPMSWRVLHAERLGPAIEIFELP